eukprot:1232078-Prymnesium_polylepis.1
MSVPSPGLRPSAAGLGSGGQSQSAPALVAPWIGDTASWMRAPVKAMGKLPSLEERTAFAAGFKFSKQKLLCMLGGAPM